MNPRLLLLVLGVFSTGTAAYSQSPKTAGRDLTGLFGRVWQVTNAPSKPAAGSIYIFMLNGTLLETSCVETYRIATWTVDKRTPLMLHVVEDKQLAFTAAITELTESTLRLRQSLARSKETREITLKAVEREFVCPDLPR
ncbi:MAG: hypothetical protein M3Y72_12245 [Acidobacteriota bacterium]|nr:hypothetical protein [Acidobacteriota bacterium]